MGVIECVLPRRTSFERWRGRARGERQVLCSNVDSVLIVQALGAGEVLLDRVARSLVLALDCDAEPVVVLTKADRCDAGELERDLDRVRRLVGPDVRVIVTSSAEGRGLDEVRSCVPAGSCAMILGESGAGKSTLLNALLGHDTLATGGVRERDDQGRHTTVARVMVALPGDAGVIADAPGLRSLPLVGHERGLHAPSRDCRGIACVPVWRLHAYPRTGLRRSRGRGRRADRRPASGNVPKSGVIHARERSNARSRCPSVIEFIYDSRLPTVRETAFCCGKASKHAVC